MEPTTERSDRPGMGRGAKIALGLAFLVAGGLMIGTVAVAAAVYRAGMLSVDVHEKRPDGVSLSIRAPMILVHAGTLLVPRAAVAQARGSAEQWWPLVEAACGGLETSPDGTFVQVDSPGEKVRIVKQRGSLVVSVDAPDATVHVSLPIRGISSLVRRLAPRG